MGLLRVLVLVLLGAGDVWGQDSIRPDQTPELFDWGRVDSTGKNYSDGAEIDSVYSWGASGIAYSQSISLARPIFREGVQNGLPAMDFDGTNDRLGGQSGSSSLFKFMHDGSAYTFVIVVRFLELGDVAALFWTNNKSETGGNHGVYLRRGADNKLKYIISKNSAGSPVIDIASSMDFDDTGSIQIISIRYDTARNPDFTLWVNGQVDTTANAANLPHSSSDATSVPVVGNTSSGSRRYIYEWAIWKEGKDDTVVAQLEQGLLEKWAGTTFPGTPQGLDTTSVSPYTVNLKWNKVADASGGYQLYRQHGPVNVTYPTYQLIYAPAGPSDTTFSDVRRLPGIQHKYKVRATNDTLNSNHSNIVDVTTDVPVWLHPELLLIENGLGQKWADTTFHFFESIPGLGAQQVRRRGMARARAGQQ